MAGIKGKSYLDLYNFLRNYDCFILLETFVEEGGQTVIEPYFKEYALTWEFAVRESFFGRAKKGKLLGFRESLNKCISVKNFNERWVFEICNEGLKFYVVPVYLSGGLDAEWETDYNSLWDFLNGSIEGKFLVVGDWNGRVGNAQEVPLEVTLDNSNISHARQSKDVIVNRKGKKVIDLCETFSLLILNGRILGDTGGEFTYVSQRGASVIDLCCVSLELLNAVRSFSVIPEHFSDHMPVLIKVLNVCSGECDDDVVPLLPKLSWGRSDVSGFCEKLKYYCKDVNELSYDSNIALQLLNELIYKSVSVKLLQNTVGLQK